MRVALLEDINAGSRGPGGAQALLDFFSPLDNGTNYALNAMRLMLATYVLNEANIFYSVLNHRRITILKITQLLFARLT